MSQVVTFSQFDWKQLIALHFTAQSAIICIKNLTFSRCNTRQSITEIVSSDSAYCITTLSDNLDHQFILNTAVLRSYRCFTIVVVVPVSRSITANHISCCCTHYKIQTFVIINLQFKLIRKRKMYEEVMKEKKNENPIIIKNTQNDETKLFYL